MPRKTASNRKKALLDAVEEAHRTLGTPINFVLQPKQCELLDHVQGSDSKATWIGYGGSRGGAKSYALRSILLGMCMAQSNIRACILRRTYDLVRENHIEPMLQEHPVLRQFYHIGNKELRLPNGSILFFRYAETKSDVDGQIGKEYKYLGVDQAEAFTEQELQTLHSCCRWPGAKPHECKTILTFNPGNIGHAYLKRVFYDKDYNDKERPYDYHFIQAYGWDNVQWAAPALAVDGLTERDYYSWSNDKRYQYFISRTQYGRDLNALPEALRIGWLLGSMDKFGGQYFDIWSPERYVKHTLVDPWAPLWMGIDWGFAHDSVALWGAANGTTVQVYRELTRKGLSPKALAQEIVEHTPPEERKRIRTIYLSHDAFSKRDERDSYARQMAPIFSQNQMPHPVPAGKEPALDAALLYDMLRAQQIEFDPSCKKVIETIPMISRNEDDLEKPVKFTGDDAFDALRHLLKGRRPGAHKPVDQAVAERAATIADPVARWLYLTHEKQKGQPSTSFHQDVRPSWMFDLGH